MLLLFLGLCGAIPDARASGQYEKIEVEWDAEPELGHPFWEHIDHSVTLPKRVILGRNLLGMFKELFIERGEWTSWRSTQI
jgi:hypothetical protein